MATPCSFPFKKIFPFFSKISESKIFTCLPTITKYKKNMWLVARRWKNLRMHWYLGGLSYQFFGAFWHPSLPVFSKNPHFLLHAKVADFEKGSYSWNLKIFHENLDFWLLHWLEGRFSSAFCLLENTQGRKAASQSSGAFFGHFVPFKSTFETHPPQIIWRI